MKSVLFEKLAALAAVVVALLFALNAVDGIVQERRARQQGAEQAVASSLAGDQTLLGPMLRRQCEETWTTPDGVGTGAGAGAGKTFQNRKFTQLLWPRRLSVRSHVAVEPRHRGLFKVNGYLSETTLEAEWRPFDPSSSAATRPDGRVSCQPPTVALVLGDVRGIRSASVTVDGIDREVRSGSAVGEATGLHAALPELPKDGAPVHAVVKLALVGTGSLAWTPVGDESTVDIDADWPHPSFAGQFLPVTREVTAQGFKAGWRVSSLASGAQQQYRAGGRVCGLQDGRADGETSASATPCADSFGVRFIDPVNPYVLSERALKYGILFIVLTFVGVALVELTRRLRVHPVQYLLVGCALTVFFLLLIGLSEHIGFGPAYACAAAACSGLLGFYGAHLLKGLRPGLMFGAAIGLLYGALFVLLRQEQTALLLGSMLLFLALAAVMIVTRRTDWYAFSRSQAGSSAPVATSQEQTTT